MKCARGFSVFLLSALAGCSGGPSSLLGGTPPQHRLLPEAKLFRDAGPTPPPRELAKVLLGPYIVEPGDGLLVQPAELDAAVRFPADQTVLPDGSIDLGSFGRPIVANRTLPEIESQIKELVKAKSKEPVTVTVRLITRASKVYYVLGEVNAPGSFPVSGRETVLDAIISAGGLTRRAQERNMLLSRPTSADGCRIVYPVCYSQIVQLGDTTTNYQIQPGDRIFVPSKDFKDDILPASCNKDCSQCKTPQVPCVGCASTGK